MDEPKLQKIIDDLKAKEAHGKLWIERNWTWVACLLSFAIGFFVGRLA